MRTEFFSVTYTTNVGQARCVPQVCYKVTDDIRGAIEKMAVDGLARLYAEEVRFISGAPVPIKKSAAQVSFVPRADNTARRIVSGRRVSKSGGRKREFE